VHRPTDDSALAVDARALTKRFREVTAVDRLDLDIRSGELFGLVGPDGAGKSTLIRMLATVLSPTSGDATIFGHSIRNDARAIKGRIGYMSQHFSLYNDLTVRENLDFFAKLRGVPRAERRVRSKRLLEFAGLTDFVDRYAQFLSGGMRQKLALAATLIHEPDLIFLDEPTTGVDPVSRREFWRIISDLHMRGITVLVATPYMDEAERCEEVAFMQSGRIVVRDTPAKLKASMPGRLVEASTSSDRDAREAVRSLPGVVSAEVYGELVQIVVAFDGPSNDAVRGAIERAGVTVAWMRDARVSMETAFAMLVAASPEGASHEGAPPDPAGEAS
jgi:ABC-2 type transport system ATP-binding protein